MWLPSTRHGHTSPAGTLPCFCHPVSVCILSRITSLLFSPRELYSPIQVTSSPWKCLDIFMKTFLSFIHYKCTTAIYNTGLPTMSSWHYALNFEHSGIWYVCVYILYSVYICIDAFGMFIHENTCLHMYSFVLCVYVVLYVCMSKCVFVVMYAYLYTHRHISRKSYLEWIGVNSKFHNAPKVLFTI